MVGTTSWIQVDFESSTTVWWDITIPMKPMNCKVKEHFAGKKAERSVKICVLKRTNDSKWAAPTFVISKKN